MQRECVFSSSSLSSLSLSLSIAGRKTTYTATAPMGETVPTRCGCWGLERGATRHMAVLYDAAPIVHHNNVIPMHTARNLAESWGCICIDAWPLGSRRVHTRPPFPPGGDTCVNFAVQTHMCVSRLRQSPKSRSRSRSVCTSHSEGWREKGWKDRCWVTCALYLSDMSKLIKLIYLSSNWYIYLRYLDDYNVSLDSLDLIY